MCNNSVLERPEKWCEFRTLLLWLLVQSEMDTGLQTLEIPELGIRHLMRAATLHDDPATYHTVRSVLGERDAIGEMERTVSDMKVALANCSMQWLAAYAPIWEEMERCHSKLCESDKKDLVRKALSSGKEAAVRFVIDRYPGLIRGGDICEYIGHWNPEDARSIKVLLEYVAANDVK